MHFKLVHTSAAQYVKPTAQRHATRIERDATHRKPYKRTPETREIPMTDRRKEIRSKDLSMETVNAMFEEFFNTRGRKP